MLQFWEKSAILNFQISSCKPFPDWKSAACSLKRNGPTVLSSPGLWLWFCISPHLYPNKAEYLWVVTANLMVLCGSKSPGKEHLYLSTVWYSVQNKAEHVILAHWVKIDVLGTAWSAGLCSASAEVGGKAAKKAFCHLGIFWRWGLSGECDCPMYKSEQLRDCSNLCRPEIPFTAILQIVLYSFYWKWISTKLKVCSPCAFAEVSVQLYWPCLFLGLPKKSAIWDGGLVMQTTVCL